MPFSFEQKTFALALSNLYTFDDCYGNSNIMLSLNKDKLLNKIDSSSVSKYGKIEAVHGLLEQQQMLCIFGC